MWSLSTFPTLKVLLIYLTLITLDDGLQWMDTTLAAGKKVDFFTDEFRCPVFVRDVVKVVLLLIANLTAGLSSTRMMASTLYSYVQYTSE